MAKKDHAYFDLQFNAFSTIDLLSTASRLPIHNFDEDIPEGKVLEIGYELGGLAMFYASKGREVHAFDREAHYEKKLQARIAKESFGEKITFFRGTVPKTDLPNEKYAIISICNVLHFSSLKTAKLIIDKACERLVPGGWILVINHHANHLYARNREIVGPKCWYKHFFTEAEVEFLLPKSDFEMKYSAVYKYWQTQKEQSLWNQYIEAKGYVTYDQKLQLRMANNTIDFHEDIVTVHRKKTSV